VTSYVELAKQVVCTMLSISPYMLQTMTSEAPNQEELAAVITYLFRQRLNSSFFTELLSSSNPLIEVEKLCFKLVKKIGKRNGCKLVLQDIRKGVAEFALRYHEMLPPCPLPSQALREMLSVAPLAQNEIKIIGEVELDWDFGEPGIIRVPDDAEGIAKQVLALFSGDPKFIAEWLFPTLVKVVVEVFSHDYLENFPRNFVLEIAKMAGCAAAKQLLGGASAKEALDEGLGIIDTLVPSNAPFLPSSQQSPPSSPQQPPSSQVPPANPQNPSSPPRKRARQVSQ